MQPKIDLHMHTTCSDGTDSVEALVNKIVKGGFTHFSITDHATIDACFEVEKYKKELNGIKFYNGTEVSCEHGMLDDLHLLGYGFDKNAKPMLDMSEKAKSYRKQRARKMFEHLENKHNIKVPKHYQDAILDIPTVGSPHVGRVLIEMGFGDTLSEVIPKYLQGIKVTELKINLLEAINTIKTCGGIASLAHPIRIMKGFNYTHKDIDLLVGELKPLGLDGIEIYNCNQSKSDIEEFITIANKYKLIMTGGSDYHGKNKPVSLGMLSSDGTQADPNLLEEFFEKVKPAF